MTDIANQFGMVFAPCIGYILQTKEMITSGSAEGFSPYVSFILVVSNLIRVFWWHAERFDETLLYASIVMLACQMVLIFFWVKVKSLKDPKFQQSLWYWRSFDTYLAFTVIIVFVLASLLKIGQ